MRQTYSIQSDKIKQINTHTHTQVEVKLDGSLAQKLVSALKRQCTYAHPNTHTHTHTYSHIHATSELRYDQGIVWAKGLLTEKEGKGREVRGIGQGQRG